MRKLLSVMALFVISLLSISMVSALSSADVEWGTVKVDGDEVDVSGGEVLAVEEGQTLNIKVETFEGLIVDFARKKMASCIIRGLRAISDFEYELQMALVNRRLEAEISTVFLMPHENYTYLNSTIVKEVASFGGDISNFVPRIVEKMLKNKNSIK